MYMSGGKKEPILRGLESYEEQLVNNFPCWPLVGRLV